MKVVILCGGYGTRIRDVADDIPKPMIPIGPYPILWHIMKSYANFGFKEFIICLGYKGQVIKNFFLNHEAYTRNLTITFGSRSNVEFHDDHKESDWKVTLVDTGIQSMTGSRISQIRDYVGNDDFMITYGDGLSDININNLVHFHKKHGKILTVSGVRPPGRFGEMVGNSYGLVSEFNEKPQATDGRISGGFFVARRSLFDYLNNDPSLVFEQEPIKKLVEDKQLMMYEHDGFWQPMDTSREFQLLNSIYESGNAPWMK